MALRRVCIEIRWFVGTLFEGADRVRVVKVTARNGIPEKERVNERLERPNKSVIKSITCRTVLLSGRIEFDEIGAIPPRRSHVDACHELG